MGESDGGAADPRRARGIEQMKLVYGWDIGEVHGDFLAATVDHLFGEVWARDGMSLRERRLLLIGMLAGQGLDDVLTIQVDAALRLGDLSAEDLDDVVQLVAHYAGWPMGAKVNQVVMEAVAKHRAASAPDPDS